MIKSKYELHIEECLQYKKKTTKDEYVKNLLVKEGYKIDKNGIWKKGKRTVHNILGCIVEI